MHRLRMQAVGAALSKGIIVTKTPAELLAAQREGDANANMRCLGVTSNVIL